eukprot:391927-Alexandrium_andersonii.AAC.1
MGHRHTSASAHMLSPAWPLQRDRHCSSSVGAACSVGPPSRERPPTHMQALRSTQFISWPPEPRGGAVWPG